MTWRGEHAPLTIDAARRSTPRCGSADARANQYRELDVRHLHARCVLCERRSARGCPGGELVRINVVTVADGLVRPWHLTFLPGGSDYLMTELPGDLRISRGGKLDAKPIPGWPTDALRARSMNSVVLHPDFARNRTLF